MVPVSVAILTISSLRPWLARGLLFTNRRCRSIHQSLRNLMPLPICAGIRRQTATMAIWLFTSERIGVISFGSVNMRMTFAATRRTTVKPLLAVKHSLVMKTHRPRISAALVLAPILFIAVSSLAQDGGAGTATPVRRAGPGVGSRGFAGEGGARSARGPGFELKAPRDGEMLAARFQATIYEVQTTTNQSRALVAEDLARQASTPETLLKSLGEVGKSRVLYRIDQPVNVFSDTITLGALEPVVTGTEMSDTGQGINSISYQSVGIMVRLSVPTPPKEADGKSPDVKVAVQLSTLGPGNTESGPGQKAGGARAATLEQSEPLAFDQPLVMLAVSSSSFERSARPPVTAGEKPATPVVYVVRYLFRGASRESGVAKSAIAPKTATAPATPAQAIPNSAEAERTAENLPARFQATFYEVHPAADRAGALDASALVSKAASADSLVKALADSGTSRILYRIDQPVNVFSDVISFGSAEPVVTSKRMSVTGQALNSFTYQTLGVSVILSAQAPPKEAHGEGTNVAMLIIFSTLIPSNTEIGLGQMATAIRSMSLQHSEPLEFGKPRVALAVCPAPAGEHATPVAYVVLYQFSRPGQNGGAAEPATPAGKVADAPLATEASATKPAAETSATNLPAQFQATFYEVHPAADRAGALDASALASQAASADSLLKALADSGTSRILYRIDQPVNVFSDQIVISTNAPLVTGTRMSSTGRAMNSMAYQRSGVSVSLSAQASPKDARGEGTNVAMMVQFSTPTPGEIEMAPGQKATVIKSLSLQHSESLEFGKPRVALAVGLSSAGDHAAPIAYVVRYLFNPPITK
jgi:hypothetical protein